METNKNSDDIVSSQQQVGKKSKIWDASIIIALIAVLISSVSAYISLKESRIMLEQQKMLSEQQEASVWPYLENHSRQTYENDTIVKYQFVVTNKGVGPAIIDKVVYKFYDESIKGWGLGESLEKKHSNLKIEQLGNSILDGNVLAPGETHVVITVKITKEQSDSTELWKVLKEMDYHLEYCYCSVYAKCWKVESKTDTKPSTECKFRENIR